MTDRPTRWPETPDIVTRLRARREAWTCIREEAAAEIEKLRSKLSTITTTLNHYAASDGLLAPLAAAVLREIEETK
jgi:hypothetical protein